MIYLRQRIDKYHPTLMDATVICNDKHQYAVIDGQGNTIVPFGTYEWIENFNRGYARVKSFRGDID